MKLTLRHRRRDSASPPPSSPAAAAQRQLGEQRRTEVARREVRRRRHLHHGAVGRPGQPRPAVARRQRQLFTVNQLAYDSLVAVERQDRRDRVAARHRLEGRRHDRDLHPGRRASPAPTAAASRATTVADNITYVGDPKNKSPFLGTFLPVGATAKADDAAGTVTITLAAARAVRAQRPGQPADGLRRRHEGPQVAGRRHRRHRPVRAHRGRARATTTPTRSATATPGDRTVRRRPSRACPTPSS